MKSQKGGNHLDVSNIHNFRFSQCGIQSITFHYPSLQSSLLFFWVRVVLQAAERKRSERSAVAPRWLLTSCALCGGPFPAFTGNAHIRNRFSLTVDSSQSQTESSLSCSGQHTEKEGGSSFETHLPHLTGCGVFPSLFFLLFLFLFFTTTYFLSLFLSLSSPNCCPLLLMQRSCFTAECYLVFSNVNTREPAWAEELPRASAVQWGSTQSALSDGNSRGPNINTACDTPSQHAFKPSARGSKHLSVASASSQSSTGYIKLSGETNWPWTQPKQSLCSTLHVETHMWGLCTCGTRIQSIEINL